MQMTGMLRALRPDRFILLLLAAIALAALAPVEGIAAAWFAWVTIAAIALMFFLHGARLEPHAVVAGLAHWRLHGLILGATFVLFPLLGLTLRAILPGLLPDGLWLGVLFVCALPSTVQSSIAFTSIARGNVAAAVVAATASNLSGIVITPLLVGLLLSRHGGISTDEIVRVAVQLLLPFLLGQVAQPRIGPWARRNNRLLGLVDRGSILLVVYGAFSAAVVAGVWRGLSLGVLGRLAVVDAVLLALALAVTWLVPSALGMARADRIAILFCGSKKSLATGVPMARILFASGGAGLAVLPLMLFHQMQLMACAAIARGLAEQPVADEVPHGATPTD